MFVYEKIEDNWLQKIKEYNFKKPLDDGCPPESYWYINREKNESLYYIGWVSSSILRCDGESMYEFAYIYKDKCMHVTAYVFPLTDGKQWNDKNKLIYNSKIIPELNNEILNQNVKEAIIFYLDNIYKDRMNKPKFKDIEMSDGKNHSMFAYKKMSEEERKTALEVYATIDFLHFGFETDKWVINENENIYLIYISCSDGTHAPKNFVETRKFFLNWKGTPMDIYLADSLKGTVLSYKIHYFKIPDHLKENSKKIIEDVKEALTVYEVAKNSNIKVDFDF
ncbi:hypothetical protein [Pseudobacteroides cellulosolvens]|uniref:Uncharacterized protein n=1 Tax=Pseudobacteroides cellulosolvens ATCC 35603 = DSM 2933 TaxID=398512 RepID=A0A0L6JII7_9FIRM|nr:hypothetical protein [Pseudobacteroides cellulosolvens]KNY25554.1 hypothetical protein Bccel_0814 [Pseudobacteroides cellulosolvens ATCC 35603 = DSM 2933]